MTVPAANGQPSAPAHSHDSNDDVPHSSMLYPVSEQAHPSLESLARAVDKDVLQAVDNFEPINIASASSLHIPHTLTSSRLRRRSDISTVKPLINNLDAEHPANEEAVTNSTTKGPTAPAIADNQVAKNTPYDLKSTYPKDQKLFSAPALPEKTIPYQEVLKKEQGTQEREKLPYPGGIKEKREGEDVENGGPSEEEDKESVGPSLTPEQIATHKRRSLIYFLTLCFSLFGMGWNDGTTGPLLPRIQDHYHVGFAVVSLVFVLNAIGYVVGGLMNVWLTDKLGFGKTLVLAAVVQLCAYIMIIPAGPFPVMVVAYGLIGFGLSLQNANGNAYVASLKKSAKTKMGILHGTYGLGAFISPLISTQFAKSESHWSFHFIASAALYVFIIIALTVVLRGKRQEVLLEEEGEIVTKLSKVENTGKFGQIIRIKVLLLLSLFAIIYVGIEVTLGGWSVTYLLEKRNGDSSTGYVSSGFFGGLMLGRVLLLWFNKKMGERTAVVVYGLLAIVLEITVWVVPSLIENAVAISVVGMLLGPMYPVLMHQAAVVLPPHLLSGCMGFIAGVASAGSALLPFLTGLLAARFGITSLQPFIITMMAILISIWASIFIQRKLSGKKP